MRFILRQISLFDLSCTANINSPFMSKLNDHNPSLELIAQEPTLINHKRNTCMSYMRKPYQRMRRAGGTAS